MFWRAAIEGTCQLLAAPAEKLKQRTYNLTAFSFTPRELADSLRKVMPKFTISYPSTPDFRQVNSHAIVALAVWFELCLHALCFCGLACRPLPIRGRVRLTTVQRVAIGAI